MSILSSYLKTDHVHLEPREILQAPPSVLLGVSAAAEESLESLAVRTVFDLALSGIFANAAKLVETGSDLGNAFSRYGAVPADIVDASALAQDVANLQLEEIVILAGIDTDNGPTLTAALDVRTVRDLALWPPYLAARAIFEAVFHPEAVPGFDPEAPTDLLPKSGEYPTERVFFETLVLEEIADDPSTLTALEAAGPIDISPAVAAEFGFKKPGTGALLTFSQSWFAQGVALGQLLHSVALAPGESTKIAMIDWSRRSSATGTESLSETEALANTTGHNRSIGEVTSAVAQEAQSGFSGGSSSSSSSQIGLAAGGLSGGFSLGAAQSGGRAASFSSSAGRRELSASMAQNILDSTQQSANAARNRRATVVREVSQAESEKVTTRAVTNYNHMHALSVQYYEVVQIYRVVVQLARVHKCLFVPMKLIDFRNAALIARFRGVLAEAALTETARRLLANDPETVTLMASTWQSGSATSGRG